MKLFNLSFEESQSIVTEGNVKKLKEKGSYKRFFGLLIASVGLYFFCVMIPTLLKGVTAAEDPHFTWLNWPLLIIFSAIYILYIVYSIKYRHSPLLLKYCTRIYMFILTVVTALCMELMMVSRRNFLGYVSGFLFTTILVYLTRTVPRKLKQSIEERTVFVPMTVLVTEKAVDGLILLGGTGITASLVVFDRLTGRNARGSIDAMIGPFIPSVFLFVIYTLAIEILGSYYLFKYSEQYREQFGYSVKDWYGEKSREYLDSQNKAESCE